MQEHILTCSHLECKFIETCINSEYFGRSFRGLDNEYSVNGRVKGIKPYAGSNIWTSCEEGSLLNIEAGVDYR